MIFVFDTNSFSELNAYYPDIFKALWAQLDALVAAQELISTREVRKELENSGLEHVLKWAKNNSGIFTIPTAAETQFVGQIFSVPHFQALIGQKAQQRGTPVADPFVIACAKVNGGTVVSQEKYKPNAAKIPNVCAHFNIPCIDLEKFMRVQKWTF
ncbi:MAG: DUF4411 family protein [Alphaproteobacteria bacterium]|nr:DUF4411 family protein [Alphaproteobacteria bacterium]